VACNVLTDFHQVHMSRIPIIVLVLLSWLGPATAAEQSPEDVRETARLHYARGLELAGQADYEAALREFTEAYAISPHFAVLYNIGQAQFALGRPLEAIESLSRYLRDGQEQIPPARRQDVQAQIALLESLFAELTITTDQAGALIAVDGREVGRTPLYQSIRLATGTHKVSAAMEGMAAITRTVTLAPGDRQVLNLEMPTAPATAAIVADAEPQRSVLPLAGATAQSAPETNPKALPASVLEQRLEPGTPGRRRTMSIVGYSAAGVGVALAGTALGVYLWNRGRYQDWQKNNAALQQDKSGIDFHGRQIANNQLADSLTRANHVIVGLSVGGGLLLAGGITLWVRDRFRGAKEAENSTDKATTGISIGWQGRSSASISWSAPW
jgi:tetratricopeptide (TPR) repeat protein